MFFTVKVTKIVTFELTCEIRKFEKFYLIDLRKKSNIIEILFISKIFITLQFIVFHEIIFNFAFDFQTLL